MTRKRFAVSLIYFVVVMLTLIVRVRITTTKYIKLTANRFLVIR